MHYSNKYTQGFIKTAAQSPAQLIKVQQPWTQQQRKQYAQEQDKKHQQASVSEQQLAQLQQQLGELKKGKNPELRNKLLQLFSTPWPQAQFQQDQDLQLRKRLADDQVNDIWWKLTQKGIPQWAIADYMSYAPEYRKQYAESLQKAMQQRIKDTKAKMGQKDKD